MQMPPRKSCGGGFGSLKLSFLVDHQDVSSNPHLVRMGAGRHRQFGEYNRARGVTHIDNRGAMRSAHVTDISNTVTNDDLATASNINKPHLLHAKRLRHFQISLSAGPMGCPGDKITKVPGLHSRYIVFPYQGSQI